MNFRISMAPSNWWKNWSSLHKHCRAVQLANWKAMFDRIFARGKTINEKLDKFRLTDIFIGF